MCSGFKNKKYLILISMNKICRLTNARGLCSDFLTQWMYSFYFNKLKELSNTNTCSKITSMDIETILIL